DGVRLSRRSCGRLGQPAPRPFWPRLRHRAGGRTRPFGLPRLRSRAMDPHDPRGPRQRSGRLAGLGRDPMSRVLLTGAGGYVGSLAARRVLGARADLILWLSARSDAEAAAKRARAAAAIGIDPDGRRVTWAWGDLRDDAPFAATPAGGITHIIHGAAV